MKKQEIKFSIVLSIYNVEKYLNRSIDSILNQTYQNFELILIDDGSTDNSSLICDLYSQKDARVKVVHKTNQGLGMARNTGIENANGDYICFFDSDDFIDRDLLKICNLYLIDCRYDILCFDFYEFRNGKVNVFANKNKPLLYIGDEVRSSFLPSMIYNVNNNLRLHGCAWNKVYSMDVIRKSKFRFVSEREFISEDYFSNLILFKEVNSVMVIPNALYFYCINETSLTHKYREDRVLMLILQYKKSLELIEKYNYPGLLVQKLSFEYFGNLQGAIKNILECKELSRTEKKRKIYSIIDNNESLGIISNLCLEKESIKRKLLICGFKKKKKCMVWMLFKIQSWIKR